MCWRNALGHLTSPGIRWKYQEQVKIVENFVGYARKIHKETIHGISGCMVLKQYHALKSRTNWKVDGRNSGNRMEQWKQEGTVEAGRDSGSRKEHRKEGQGDKLKAICFTFFTSRFSAIKLYSNIIPTPHHYTYFEQFDWLEKKFYTSINSISRNLGTIFLLPAPKCTIMSTEIWLWWESWNYKEWITISEDFVDV